VRIKLIPVPGHAELTVVGLCGGLDLEVIADATQRRVEHQRDAAAAGAQAASHVKPLPVERHAVGNEPDVRVLLGVEEVGGAQMRVALLVVGVDAVGLYGELDRRLGGEVQGAVVSGEAALDRVVGSHGGGDPTRRCRPAVSPKPGGLVGPLNDAGSSA